MGILASSFVPPSLAGSRSAPGRIATQRQHQHSTLKPPLTFAFAFALQGIRSAAGFRWSGLGTLGGRYELRGHLLRALGLAADASWKAGKALFGSATSCGLRVPLSRQGGGSRFKFSGHWLGWERRSIWTPGPLVLQYVLTAAEVPVSRYL